MKAKLEFPVVCVLWWAICALVVLAVGDQTGSLTLVGGIGVCCLLALLTHVQTGSDLEIMLLLRLALYLLVLSAVCSVAVNRDVYAACMLGIDMGLLLSVERGYTYAYSYR